MRTCSSTSVYFQQSMRLIANAKFDVRVRRGWVSEDNFVAIMRLRPEDLCKWLMVKLEGEDALDYGTFPASGSSSPRTRCSTRATDCSSIWRTSE